MPVLLSMLRGVNLGPHNRIKMDQLRALYKSLRLQGAQTYVQSGNVVFRTGGYDAAQLSRRIEGAIDRTFGFRPSVILRSTAELKSVIARNPFAQRRDIEPSKLLVTFLATDPAPDARDKLSQLKTDPQELLLDRRELYIYFPDGMARPKFSWPAIDRILHTPATGRNWNTVTKLLELAEKLEASL